MTPFRSARDVADMLIFETAGVVVRAVISALNQVPDPPPVSGFVWLPPVAHCDHLDDARDVAL